MQHPMERIKDRVHGNIELKLVRFPLSTLER